MGKRSHTVDAGYSRRAGSSPWQIIVRWLFVAYHAFFVHIMLNEHWSMVMSGYIKAEWITFLLPE